MLTLLGWSRTEDSGPATEPTTQIPQENTITHTKHHKKLYNIDKSNNKAHTLTIKSANNSDISLAFCLSCDSVALALMASRTNLHKRLEALARCYVTSHW